MDLDLNVDNWLQTPIEAHSWAKVHDKKKTWISKCIIKIWIECVAVIKLKSSDGVDWR